jgi:hypothetical protein
MDHFVGVLSHELGHAVIPEGHGEVSNKNVHACVAGHQKNEGVATLVEYSVVGAQLHDVRSDPKILPFAWKLRPVLDGIDLDPKNIPDVFRSGELVAEAGRFYGAQPVSYGRTNAENNPNNLTHDQFNCGPVAFEQLRPKLGARAVDWLHVHRSQVSLDKNTDGSYTATFKDLPLKKGGTVSISGPVD